MTVGTEKRFAVAGIPRSGTTMIFRALAGYPRGATTPKNYAGPLLKTHSRKPTELASIEKAIFLFGDPVASVLSTRINRWNKEHFENCGAGDVNPDDADIYGSDVLGYEEMFDVWMQRQPFKLICVKYESIHKNLTLLNSFFGQHLYVPPYRDRQTDLRSEISGDDLSKIKSTYSRLIQKVETAPDIAIYEPL